MTLELFGCMQALSSAAACACLLLAAQPSAAATVITFDGAPQGPIASYAEGGFTVTPSAGSWFASAYGAPGPSLQFEQPLSGSVRLTSGGATFTFDSIDLYASIIPIPYVISGYLNSTQVFSMSGTVPNTFGNFARVPSTSALAVDAITITLTNSPPPCCSNPMGLDNIVLSPVSQVPEPGNPALYLLGLSAIALRLGRKG